MTNYVKSTNFATKDNLASGDPLKIVKGTEINTEYDNIAVAVATKADTASPTFTGTVTIPTLALTNDLPVTDGGTGASTAANARTNLSAASSGANSDITSITGLTTALTVPQGGTGAATLTANNVVLGNGTSSVQFVAPGTSGNVLVSNGTTWTSGSSGVTSVSGINGLTGTVTTSGSLSVDTTFGNVGTYAVLQKFSSGAVIAGSTASGTNLGYVSAFNSGGSSFLYGNSRRAGNVSVPGTGYAGVYNDTIAVSGTWRSMSSDLGSSYDSCNNVTIASNGLWIRTA